MQDVEFTIEEGRLFLLQTRAAKRPAQAAVRFAVDAVGEGLLTREEALLTIDAEALEALLHPVFDPSFEFEVLTTGVAASPGAASGAIVLSAAEAVRRAADGEDVILVRPFTEADDIAGFHAARGILTAQGGKASHAALVARGMGRPCVAGASEVKVDAEAGVVRIGETELAAGDLIAIEGTTGKVTADEVPLIEPEISEHFDEVLRWSDELRRLGVRANADTAAGRGQGALARAPRGSASAGPSTCSSARTAASWCAACSSPPPAGGAPRSCAAADGGPAPPELESARERVPRGARAARRAPARRLRGDPARDARPAGDGPAARSAAARVPAARALRGRGAPARGGGRRSAHRCPRGGRDRPRPAGGEPDARHARACASPSSIRRSTRCRCGR